MKTMTPTARDTVAKNTSDIAKLLDVLQMEVDSINTESELKPSDWAYAGDLGHVRQKLIEALSFISGHSEDAVSEACED